jgi:hypothetical protein
MLLQSAWPCRVGKIVQSFLTQSSLSPGQHCGLPVFHDFVFIIGASANTMKLLEWQPCWPCVFPYLAEEDLSEIQETVAEILEADTV